MEDDLLEFMTENGGVATVTELADVLEEDENAVRRWARHNGVRRAGTTFVFSEQKAFEYVEYLNGDEEESEVVYSPNEDDEDDEDDDVEDEE